MDDGYNREASRELTRLLPALRFLRPYVKQVVFAGFALVATAGITLSIGQGLRMVIDQGFSGDSGALLERAILIFSVLVVGLTLGTMVRFYLVSWIGERVSADIRLAVFKHLIRLHPAFFEENRPTEIQSRITTDTTLLQTVIGSSASIALRNALMFIGGVVLLVLTNPRLTLVVLVSAPLVVAPILFIGRRVRRLSRSSQDRLADVGTHAGESLRYVKIVQSFNHEARDESEFTDRVGAAFGVAVRRIRQRTFLIALVMLMVMAAIGVMLWIGGQDVISGRTSAGELAAFIFYAFIVAGAVGAISEVYSDLQRAAGAMERLVELLGAADGLPEPAKPAALPKSGGLTLSVRNLSFAYPARPEVSVLNDVSFQVRPGEMVALVGPSGTGKSTLFDLIQRFYDPSGGTISLNECGLRTLRRSDVRERIGFVPQDPVLFSGALRSNVLYGNPDATTEQLHNALRLAHAETFVSALPKGLDTFVGEGGVGLSGGQKQRLAIARALLTDPALLLLDEATSALDAESEHAIRRSIDEIKGRCSILVIAHRLSTVRQADRILVLDRGALVAEGGHDALIRSNDLYARFTRLQLEGRTLPAA